MVQAVVMLAAARVVRAPLVEPLVEPQARRVVQRAQLVPLQVLPLLVCVGWPEVHAAANSAQVTKSHNKSLKS